MKATERYCHSPGHVLWAFGFLERWYMDRFGRPMPEAMLIQLIPALLEGRCLHVTKLSPTKVGLLKSK